MDELEEWRPISGYETRYAVSDQGHIWSLTENRPLRPQFGRAKGKTNGYSRVTLWNGIEVKKWFIHALVLRAFIGPRPSDEHEAAHNNGNSVDNRLANLRWATKKENHRDRYEYGSAYGIGKVTPEMAVTQAVRNGVPQTEVARQFNLSQQHVSNLAAGRNWPHIDRSSIQRAREQA